jgi:integrase/recombinase XerD
VKVSGNGKAKILNPAEIKKLFGELQRNPRNAALFAICFFTGCRISEALQLETRDISEGMITFRKRNTKGKLKTRTVPIHPSLQRFLDNYQPKKPGYLFPGMVDSASPYLSRNSADRILKTACDRVGIVGASTHSFRRTALTHMSRSGVPLRTIQEISGHGDLGTLQRYLEVTPEEVAKAINNISF